MPGRPDARDGAGRTGVAAVVTAFHPDEHLVRVCRSAVDQVDALVVVDDGTPAPDEAVLDACRALGALVVRHPRNLGIGAALNTGVRTVREQVERGAELDILTLDQDSVLPPGYVVALVAAARRAMLAGVRVAMVGPGQATGVRRAADADGDGADKSDGSATVVYSKEPIQSGLLVPAATFDALGLFADELFIDGVDTELYLRARTRRMHAVAAPDARLEHRLGQRHVVRLAGRELPVVHAAAFRYYYIGRNRVLLCRRYGRSQPTWAVTSVGRDLRHLLVVTVLVPGRRARLRAYGAGLRDGVRGVTGPRPGPG